MSEPAPDPQPTEPTPAPEVFADGYHSSSVQNGAVKLTFFSLQHNVETNRMERRIVLRLTVPLGPAAGVHQGLGAILAQVEANLAGRAN